MADVEISYNNSVIAALNSTGAEVLETDGTFMTDDVTISYTKPSVGTDTSDATLLSGYQMLNGYTAYARGTKYTGAILSRAAQTITPTISNQTIPSGLYLSGTQTIEGIVCTNLTAANIADGVTVKIGTATDDDSVASVTGTHQGGGGTLITKTVTANGVYNASSDNADGYSTVTVNVSGGGGSIATTAVFIPGSTGTTICYTDANMTAHKETSNGSVSANLPIGSIVTISNTSGVPAFESGREPTGVTQLIALVVSRVTRAIIYKVDAQSL